ncbi:MAG: SRPBCC family protein [Leptolyngbyaceae cyanobacterium]
MLKAQSSIVIDRSVEEVFRYIAHNFFDNYPKWDASVVDLKKTSPAPMGLGTQGWQIMDGNGWRAENDFYVNDYEPSCRFSITGSGQTYFKNSYALEPVGSSTKLIYDFEFSLQSFGKLFEALMAKAVKKASQETVCNLQKLIETSA